VPDRPDRVAIVTGGSRGIGQAAALRLATDGTAVVVGYLGNELLAGAVVAAIAAGGGRAISVQVDVADEDAVAGLFDAAEEAYGSVDVVVHTAGILVLAPVAEFDLAALDRMHRTNTRGTFVVNQQAARRLRRGGAIVNLSSSAVRRAHPAYAAYAASKGAVDAVSLIVAKELQGATSPSTRSLPERLPPRCSSTAKTTRPSRTQRARFRSGGSERPQTSRRSCPSSPARAVG
jgi:3-oxoacyl-[acyl-carrier protein] reductase